MTRGKFLATTAAASLSPLLGYSYDAANARPRRRVTLLYLADTHAQFETHPDDMPGEHPEIQQMGGFARLKTAIDRERAGAQGATFLVDSGDAVQGSGPVAWSQGAVVVEPLNALGIDAFVPGNWEVVYGPERFKELMTSSHAILIRRLTLNYLRSDRTSHPQIYEHDTSPHPADHAACRAEHGSGNQCPD